MSVLINSFCDIGAAKYRRQTGLLNFCSFQYASRKKLFFRFQVFPTALDYHQHNYMSCKLHQFICNNSGLWGLLNIEEN